MLNGDVPKALNRLAANTDAALLVVGAGRPGSLERLDRAIEGSVSTALIHIVSSSFRLKTPGIGDARSPPVHRHRYI